MTQDILLDYATSQKAVLMEEIKMETKSFDIKQIFDEICNVSVSDTDVYCACSSQ